MRWVGVLVLWPTYKLMGRTRVDLGRWSLTLTLALTRTVFTASVIAAHHFNLVDCFVMAVCALSRSFMCLSTHRSKHFLQRQCLVSTVLLCLCMGDEVVLSHGCPQCALVLLHANLLRACGSCDCGCHPRTSPECVLGGFGETHKPKSSYRTFFPSRSAGRYAGQYAGRYASAVTEMILCLFVSRYNQAGQPRQVRDILLTLSLQFDDRAVADGGHTDR